MFIPWSAGVKRNLHRPFQGKRSRPAINSCDRHIHVAPVTGEYHGMVVRISVARCW